MLRRLLSSKTKSRFTGIRRCRGCGGRSGNSREIPAPGQNEKKVVYGGVDYATGKITYTIADSKSGMNFLIFLVGLGQVVRRSQDSLGVRQRTIPPHTCNPGVAQGQFRSDHGLLAAAIQPESESDRALWGHLKRTVLANVLVRNP